MTSRILYQLTSPMHRTLGQSEIDRRRDILLSFVSPGTGRRPSNRWPTSRWWPRR
jgi:hypothetical protein